MASALSIDSVNPEDPQSSAQILGKGEGIAQFGLHNKIDVQKKLIDIKQERKELRIKLDLFQKNFEQTNCRKIKFTKDIGPVANDFKRYKDMKNDIAKLEAWLIQE